MKQFESFASVTSPFLRNAQKIKSYFETAIPEASLLLKYKDVGLQGRSKKFIDLLKGLKLQLNVMPVFYLLEIPAQAKNSLQRLFISLAIEQRIHSLQLIVELFQIIF